MTAEVYRKFGRVVRRENELLVRVDEAGRAVEDGGTFACEPLDDSPPALPVDVDAVHATADAIAAIVRPPVVVERLIVSDGVAEHQFGEVRWSDRMRRVHLAVACAPYRALIDLADFSTETIQRVVSALPRVRSLRSVPRVRLAANVGAALLPQLAGRIALQQWAAPHDGKGEWIANVPVNDGTPPNWFRPSYRARPLRAWFHLRADPFGDIDPALPEAIALLAPIHDRTLHVLCVDASDAFAATIDAERILAASPSDAWFPYAAGCFGAQLVM